MNGSDRERVKELLSRAAGLPAPQRRSFIERSAENRDVAAEAIDLLSTLDDSAFLNAVTGAGLTVPQTARPASSSGDQDQTRQLTGTDPALEGPGTRIGRYKLLQRIGEGGFGTVFMAEQVEPVVRRVALKIIKAGMDTKAVIARFEAERQALAMMDHPNIARVLDAGATDLGRPYFVMELVRGDPVTHYCDRQQLSIDDRLKLFQAICEAVQHAHQKGIIHRDIKPSNVLVTVADGRPLPKVIDFGIAKATAIRLTEKTLFTELHQLIGTPEYMSPEQAEVSGIDIDTRSDVYSLGVLLYELLAGTPPFESGRFRSAPFAEIQRIIRDEEPPRPSTRLRTLVASSNIVLAPQGSSPKGQASSAASALEIAQRRKTEPGQLARTLRGDLDWIVMKCLEKDRSRRYETAIALSVDIGRHLSREPVSATPPSAIYKLTRFIQRHRAGVGIAAIIAAALVIATTVSLVFALRASRALAAEAKQRRAAQESAAETRQVAQFQADSLAGIDPEAIGNKFKNLFREQVSEGLGRRFVGEWPDRRKLSRTEIDAELKEYDRIVGATQSVDVARRVLDQYLLGNDVDVIKKKFADQPRVQAELLQTLGVVSRKLGLNDKCQAALEDALVLRQADETDDDIPLADTLSELAAARAAAGKNAEAEQLHRQALAIYRDRLGEADPKSVQSLNMVGNNTYSMGKTHEAVTILREALTLARTLPPENHYTVAQVLSDLGGALQDMDETNAAEPLIRESLDLRRKLLGNEHKEVADCLQNLAGVYHDKRDFETCWKLLHECMEIKRKVLGDEHVEIATILNNLGSVRYAQDDLVSAKKLFAESLAMSRRLLGDEHPDVPGTLNNLGMMLQAEGDNAAAEPMLREALDIRRRILEKDHPYLGLSVSNLALQLQKQGDHDGAITLYREALEILPKKLPANHQWCCGAQVGLVKSLLIKGEIGESEQILNGMNAKLGVDGVANYHRRSFIKRFVELFEAKEKAAPDQGYAAKADEWRKKLEPATSQPKP